MSVLFFFLLIISRVLYSRSCPWKFVPVRKSCFHRSVNSTERGALQRDLSSFTCPHLPVAVDGSRLLSDFLRTPKSSENLAEKVQRLNYPITSRRAHYPEVYCYCTFSVLALWRLQPLKPLNGLVVRDKPISVDVKMYLKGSVNM